MQTFNELVNIAKQRAWKKELENMGQALNRDIVKELKKGVSPEVRKELNKQRISALGLKLIQGEKDA